MYVQHSRLSCFGVGKSSLGPNCWQIVPCYNTCLPLVSANLGTSLAELRKVGLRTGTRKHIVLCTCWTSSVGWEAEKIKLDSVNGLEAKSVWPRTPILTRLGVSQSATLGLGLRCIFVVFQYESTFKSVKSSEFYRNRFKGWLKTVYSMKRKLFIKRAKKWVGFGLDFSLLIIAKGRQGKQGKQKKE